jgi:hypothetical protein
MPTASQNPTAPRRHVQRAATVFSVIAATLALAACSNLLEVSYPGRIPVEQLNNPSLADVLADGVVGDLECAYNNYFSGSSAHSDEFETANDNGTLANAGERNITANNDDYATSACEASSLNTAGDFGLQVPMHTARFQAEDVFNRLKGWTDAQVKNRTALEAKVRAYGAYAYTFFGETYCTFAVDGGTAGPVSVASNTAAQEFAEAIQLANAAITAGQSSTSPSLPDIIGMSNVGLARVNMDLKKWPEAASFAQKVAPGFEVFGDRGTENDRRWNKMFYLFTDLGAYTLACALRPTHPSLGAVDAPCGTTPPLDDPRLQVADAGKGAFNPEIRLWIQTKFKNLGQKVRLASYKEARLILAEAQAQQGLVSDAQTTINNYRDLYALPHLTFGSKDDAIAKILQERRMELSFEGGHRLNDLLRYQIPWKRSGTSNPFTNRPYGTTTCWPTPTKEIDGH